MHMRIRSWFAVAAFAATGCSTASGSLRQCEQLSGLYEPGACHQEEKVPLTEILLPDGTTLAGVKRVSVEQTACSEVRIKPVGRADMLLVPTDDSTTRWDDDGALVGGTASRMNITMVLGAAKSSKEWRLAISNISHGLTYTFASEDRGMALLLIPFHERKAASCEWVRVVAR
jgi:hypothetical protein